MVQVTVGGDGSIWALSDETDGGGDHRVYRRSGVTASAPLGTSWEFINGTLGRICADANGHLWGAGKSNGVIYRYTGSFSTVPNDGGVKFSEVAVGANGAIWALSTEVDSGGDNPLYRREGVTAQNPVGTHWTRQPATFCRISVDPKGGCWGVGNSNHKIYRPAGSGWAWLENDGGLGFVRVAVGANGAIWALSTQADGGGDNYLYRRDGVTASNPHGTGWTRDPGGNTIGSLFVDSFGLWWGASRANGKVYTAEAPAGNVHNVPGLGWRRLDPWPRRTALAPGSSIAIRLRRAMTDYSGHSEAWVKFLGLATSGESVDAVDATLTARNIFTVDTYWPDDAQDWYHLDFPWFRMRASNGKYVTLDDAKLWANGDGDSACTFCREGNQASRAAEFMRIAKSYGEREARYAFVRQNGGHYTMALSPFSLEQGHIIGWYCGSAPTYGAYVSANVDFYTVHPA